ncbi:MAG: hypothetical protein ACK5KO_07960 [Arachnia sp.]
MTAATGLGKARLYNLFPGGKQQMLAEVLADVCEWFEDHVFTPLDQDHPDIDGMFEVVTGYFDSGRGLCLVGRIGREPGLGGLGDASAGHFVRWQESFAGALHRDGRTKADAEVLAEEVVAGIQGALILAHTRNEPAIFTRAINRLQRAVTR